MVENVESTELGDNLVDTSAQDPVITYIEASDNPDSFELTLPQSVAISGIFAATRGHFRELRGADLSDDDLRNPKGDETVKFARLLMLNVVSRIKQIDEEQIAKEFGYKNKSTVLREIDKSYLIADDEIAGMHMRSLRNRYRFILRAWATAKTENSESDRPDPNTNDSSNVETAPDPKIVKAIELFRKDNNAVALEILYAKYADIIEDVLDEFGEVPGWLNDEAYEIFEQLFKAIDFNLVTDIDAEIREALRSGLADVLESNKSDS